MSNFLSRRIRTVSHSSDKATAVQNPAFSADDGWRGSRSSLVSDASFTYGDGSNHNTFHNYARIGDTQGIKTVILQKKKALKYIDSLDKDGLAPLHYAARFNHIDCVKYLVDECNADVMVRDTTDHATPLHYAAKKKDVNTESLKAAKKIIKYIADKMNEKSIDVNVQDKYMSTPLHFAAMRGNEVVTKALLACPNINVNANDHRQATPLHDAVTYNHVNIVKLLLEHNADIFDTDEEASTVLHSAAMQGNLEIVMLLVEHAPKKAKEEVLDKETYHSTEKMKFVEAKDKVFNMALHLAVENKNTDVVRYLLDTETSTDPLHVASVVNSFCRPYTTKSTPLHLAAIGGDENIIEMLINKGADVHLKDGDGMTPVHRAVEFDHIEVVKMLLDQNAPIDASDLDMYTPLLLACCSDTSVAVMKELLNRGANVKAIDNHENTAIRLCTQYNNISGMKVLLKYLKRCNDLEFINATDRLGNTAVHLACRIGRDEIAELLLDHNAEWHIKNEEEETPFHLCAMNGHEKVCEILLEKTDNKVLNDEDEDSNTALHLASQFGHLNVVKLLANVGADKEARNMNMWTPLDFSASEGHTDIVSFLLEEDVPVNPADKEGTTPLHLGCKNGHLETVKLLLESGASVEQQDKEGNNALDIAIDNHHSAVAAAIIECPAWKEALMSYSYRGKSKKRDTPMRKLVRKMPNVAEMVLDKCLTLGPEGVSPEHDDAFIYFDYEIVDDNFSDWTHKEQVDVYNKKGRLNNNVFPYSENSTELKENSVLWLMIKHNRGDLLFHPLVLGLIRNKWNLGSIFFYIFILFYCLYLSMLTGYTMVAKAPHTVNSTSCVSQSSLQTNFEKSATLILYILCGVGMSLEVFQIWAIRSKYFEPNNILDWFTYISTILVLLPLTNCGIREKWQWELAAFTVFIAWLDMLLFLRRLPRAGLYVVMIAEIFKTFMRFFIIFFLFIVAFACSFNILLRDQAPFSNLFYSIIKVWVMMIGEMDFTDLFHNETLYYESMTYVIFVAFLILMTIIIMNLLTGLAVDDVNLLQANAMVKKVTMQIELALDVEVALPYWIQRRVWFVMKGQTLYPNKEGNVVLRTIRKILEGSFLSRESIMEKVLEKAGEEDSDQGQMEFQEKVLRKMKHQNQEISAIKEQMDVMMGMLQKLVSKKEKRRSSRLAQALEDAQ